ncbi:MAG: hypothetical protein M1831_004134 [Alyxoria varia]|nr:MAG: hypothetical protein M1831_004134 [Alyxoria varia]
MTSHGDQTTSITPAHLDYLAIYSPELALPTGNEEDQVVFYYSHHGSQKRRQTRRALETGQVQQDEKQEKMRHVGLAQGMVTFARTFSNDAPVEFVESEKHRTVLKELEPGWWITASITLTAISHSAGAATSEASGPKIEYSAREVSHPELLVRQLTQAYRVFLLHTSDSVRKLYSRLPRNTFCDMLSQYWTGFIRRWDVMLHGNPAVDIYDGIKLAVGGELGIGVGEEEFGSGEREVLEDLVRNTDGLIDMIVSRFEECSSELGSHNASFEQATLEAHKVNDWLSTLQEPSENDGVIFTGLGRLSRSSLLPISHWLEDVYRHGEECYGINANPSSTRRKKRRSRPLPEFGSREVSSLNEPASRPPGGEPRADLDPVRPSIPPPIVPTVEASLEKVTSNVSKSEKSKTTRSESQTRSDPQRYFSDPDVWVKYLTLGYGSSWSKYSGQTSSSTSKSHADEHKSNATKEDGKFGEASRLDKSNVQGPKDSIEKGRFLVGLTGCLEQTADYEDDSNDTDNDSAWDNCISLRTFHVEVNTELSSTFEQTDGSEEEHTESLAPDEKLKTSSLRVRIALYVAIARLSTLDQRGHQHHTSDGSYHPDQLSPIYSLLFDPLRLIVHSSIPNIPPLPTLDSGSEDEGLNDTNKLSGAAIKYYAQAARPWTRLEALTVHAQILSSVADARRHSNRSPKEDHEAEDRAKELERSTKSARGWWIVSSSIPTHPKQSDKSQDELEERNRKQLEWSNQEGQTAGGRSFAVHAESSQVVLIQRWATPPKGTKNAMINSSLPTASQDSAASTRTSSGSSSWAGAISGLGGSMRGIGQMGKNALATASGTQENETDMAQRARRAEGIGIGVDVKKYGEALLALNLGR